MPCPRPAKTDEVYGLDTPDRESVRNRKTDGEGQWESLVTLFGLTDLCSHSLAHSIEPIFDSKMSEENLVQWNQL